MKPLYVKKNGVVYKISGNGMPASYPAANVEYDNTVTSELQATDVQGAIDELSTRQGGVQSDWDENDTTELDYIKNKPQNLVQDASYVHTDNNYDATAKGKVDNLGTASAKDVGVANGVAELDAAGKVPSSQLPSFVDDVIEVADYDHLPITGESGKIYVTLDTNKTYRWTGSGYAEISESLALGETSSTAYRGDRGKTAYDHASETKLSAATASGLYKVAATAQGHISSLTAVQKSDITGLGIPAQDTIIKNTAYGTCDTAGDVKDKVATLVDATNWLLEVGTIVGIRFTYTNTYTFSAGNSVTLNVNNSGAKNIRYGNGSWSGTDDIKCPTAFGEAGQTIYYMYDGTYWVWVSHSKDNDTLYNFKGNEFRSIDGNNYATESGMGGNANNIKVNGHYYYNSNGPSTAIGASATDGALYVQALDSDYAVQIAQNYENGNIFVRGLNDGTWTDWKKPNANITGNNTVLTTDKTPFLTRQTINPTGFSGYVREKLIGASYAWNQLLTNGDFSNGTNTWTARQGSVSVSNGIATVTPSSEGTQRGITGVTNQMSIIAGHKYLLSAWIKPPINGSASCGLDTGSTTQSVTANTWNFVANIVNAESGVTRFYCLFAESVTTSQTIQYKNCQTIDLTLAFGSTIADYLYNLSDNGGITKLRDMGCPIDKYTPYGYNLVSSKTSGKKIVGKNLLGFSNVDFTISNVNFKSQNNTVIANGTASTNISSTASDYKNNFKFTLSAGTYYFSINTSGVPTVRMMSDDTVIVQGNGTFTLSQKTELYLGIYIPGNTVFSLRDLKINLTIGSTTTTYEPYSSTTYSLGNDELRGKFDLVDGEIVASGDVKESNGEITRKYAAVNLGALTWTYSAENVIFYAVMSGAKNSPNNCICAKYTDHGRITAFSQLSDKEVSVSSGLSTDPLIVIKDTAYNDATAFKTAMNGIYLIYELATPTTEQSTPFADPMSLVGATTEEYIDTRDIPCPVGAERQYMGQSEDVIEIPSSPLSDGKRKLVAETSGGKTQYYWEGESIAPVRKVSINIKDYTTENNAFTCPCDGYIFVRLPSGSGHVLMRLMDSLGNVVGTYTDAADTEEAKAYSVFVKRGIKTYAYCYVGETLEYTYWFYGIV